MRICMEICRQNRAIFITWIFHCHYHCTIGNNERLLCRITFSFPYNIYLLGKFFCFNILLRGQLGAWSTAQKGHTNIFRYIYEHHHYLITPTEKWLFLLSFLLFRKCDQCKFLLCKITTETDPI